MIDVEAVTVEVVDEDLTDEFMRRVYSARSSDKLGIDIETSGLDYIHDRIATVQVYSQSAGVQIVRIRDGQSSPGNIRYILEDPTSTKIFHYGMFDLSFLGYKWKIYARNVEDTRIAATLLDPYKNRYFNPTRNKYDHGLAALVWTYFKDRLDKELAVSNWFGNLSPAQLSYASKDVIYLPALLDIMHAEMLHANPRLSTVAKQAYFWLPGKVYCKINNMPDPLDRV